MIESTYLKHKNCELSIRWQYSQALGKNRAALCCKDHNDFIDWIPDDLAFELLDNGELQEELWKPTARQLKKQKANEQRLKNEALNKQRRAAAIK